MFDINLNFWLIFGFFGQFLFFMRFVIQWIHSERKGESTVPIHFWYFSIAGAIVILIYAIQIKDIVFMTGQGLALLIYFRNLVLIKRVKKLQDASKPKNN